MSFVYKDCQVIAITSNKQCKILLLLNRSGMIENLVKLKTLILLLIKNASVNLFAIFKKSLARIVHGLVFGAVVLGISGAFSPVYAVVCRELEGVDDILGTPDLRYLVVGDVHGTNEIPLLFSDIVCHAALVDRKILVALEWPETINEELQNYLMASTDDRHARSRLIEAMNFVMIGGLGSEAMFKLLDYVKLLKKNNLKLIIKPFQPIGTYVANDYEKKMAGNIITDGIDQDLVLILVGNAHALRGNGLTNVVPMAVHLPSKNTVTMNTAAMIGQHWGCRSPEINSENCHEWPLLVGVPQSRAVYWGYKIPGLFDATFSVGSEFTASQPETPTDLRPSAPAIIFPFERSE